MLPKAKSKCFAVRAFLLAIVFAGTAQFTAAQQTRKAPASMTVDDVIKLVQAGVAEEFIIDRLKQANKPIELSVDDLIKLRQNNVSDNIQRVMKNPSFQIVPPREPPPPPPPPPVVEQPPKPDSTDERKSVADKPADPDSPDSPHDPGIYLYAKDGSGKDRMTILDRAAPKYPNCSVGRIMNFVDVIFPGTQAVIRAKDTRPVFYFSFENTGGNSQFTDTSLTTPSQFTLVPISPGKKGRQIKLAANCTAPTKIAVRFKAERIRPGFYKLTLLEPLAAGDYAFFGSGALPSDVFEFGIDAGGAAITVRPEPQPAEARPVQAVAIPTPAASAPGVGTQESYWDFKITKSEQPQKVGDVSILLNRADWKRHTYTIVLVVDDGMVWKNDRAVGETVRFMMAKSRQPYEIVNSMTNDSIAGHISAPRVNAESAGYSVLAAANAEEAAALRNLAGRTHLQFDVTKSNEPQKIGDVSILLKQTNVASRTYTITLVVDDGMVWKNDRPVNKTVRFMTAKSGQPYELVVNRVSDDAIAGYISVPPGPRGDLTGIIIAVAANAEELAALRARGDRNYFEFEVTRSKLPVNVADIGILLRKADLKKHIYTIELISGETTLEKKDKVMNEPIEFMTSKSKQPYVLVVNKITKDTVAGYLSIPKVLNQRN